MCHGGTESVSQPADLLISVTSLSCHQSLLILGTTVSRSRRKDLRQSAYKELLQNLHGRTNLADRYETRARARLHVANWIEGITIAGVFIPRLNIVLYSKLRKRSWLHNMRYVKRRPDHLVNAITMRHVNDKESQQDRATPGSARYETPDDCVYNRTGCGRTSLPAS